MSQTPTTERRRSPRRKPAQLVYLEFGRDNGGMVKDVSEGGMRFSLMGPVVVGQTLQFSVNLDAARRIEGQAKMIWTEANGKSGGLSFAELSEQSRETLRAWLAEIDGPASATLPAPPAAPTRVPPAAVLTPSAFSAPVAKDSLANDSATKDLTAKDPVARGLAIKEIVERTPASPTPVSSSPATP